MVANVNDTSVANTRLAPSQARVERSTHIRWVEEDQYGTYVADSEMRE
jgi:hypothetical protein